jgi:hypothetical protein
MDNQFGIETSSQIEYKIEPSFYFMQNNAPMRSHLYKNMKGSSRCHVPLIEAFFPELSLDFDDIILPVRVVETVKSICDSGISSGLLHLYGRCLRDSIAMYVVGAPPRKIRLMEGNAKCRHLKK